MSLAIRPHQYCGDSQQTRLHRQRPGACRCCAGCHLGAGSLALPKAVSEKLCPAAIGSHMLKGQHGSVAFLVKSTRWSVVNDVKWCEMPRTCGPLARKLNQIVLGHCTLPTSVAPIHSFGKRPAQSETPETDPAQRQRIYIQSWR